MARIRALGTQRAPGSAIVEGHGASCRRSQKLTTTTTTRDDPAMPETAGLITALILERPMCLDCIASRAGASLNEVEASFRTIGHVLRVRRNIAERCRACGALGLSFSLERLPATGPPGEREG